MSGGVARDTWWRRLPPAAWPATLAVLVFLPSLWIGFLYDDVAVVVENRHIRDLSRLGTVLAYEPARPLLNLTWALNYAAGGLAPWHWHLVNVLIHAGNAFLVTRLFLWIGARLGWPEARPVALVSGCLFAVTPMAVETAAYVASRSTAMASLFALAALLVGAPALESGDRRRLAAALGLTVLGLAVKEEALAIPLLLLVIDLMVLSGGRWRATWGRLARHAPFLALVPVGLFARRLLTGEWLPPAIVERHVYLAAQLAELPGYLGRAAVPLDPAFYRGLEAPAWPPSAGMAAWMAVGAGLLAGAAVFRRRWPLPCLAVLWLAAGLAPSSSFVPLREMAVDHRAYLAGAGVCLAQGVLLWRMGGARIAAVVVVLLAARSVQYQWVLASPVRAWSDAVARAPQSPGAHRALADAHARAGNIGDAEQSLTTALQLDPSDLRTAVNLGALYAETGRYQQAVRVFERAAVLDPANARIRDNLGMLLLAQGEAARARREFEAAVRGQPALAQPRINLAALLLRTGEKERAADLLDAAARLEIDARDAEAIERLRAQLR